MIIIIGDEASRESSVIEKSKLLWHTEETGIFNSRCPTESLESVKAWNHRINITYNNSRVKYLYKATTLTAVQKNSRDDDEHERAGLHLFGDDVGMCDVWFWQPTILNGLTFPALALYKRKRPIWHNTRTHAGMSKRTRHAYTITDYTSLLW